MATGDKKDMLYRLKAVFPRWTGDEASNHDAILSAYASTAAFIYDLYQYVKLQTRIKTATEDNLDLISKDYLGDELPRRVGESDDNFRSRLLAFLLPFPSTRQGISDAVLALTGRRPLIFEPWYVGNSGVLNSEFVLNQTLLGTYSDIYEATFFITVYRPTASGQNFPALNNDFYLNSKSNLWNAKYIGREVTDEDIYRLIKKTKAAGVTALVTITD